MRLTREALLALGAQPVGDGSRLKWPLPDGLSLYFVPAAARGDGAEQGPPWHVCGRPGVSTFADLLAAVHFGAMRDARAGLQLQARAALCDLLGLPGTAFDGGA